jgi:hypothetical protein
LVKLSLRAKKSQTAQRADVLEDAARPGIMLCVWLQTWTFGGKIEYQERRSRLWSCGIEPGFETTANHERSSWAAPGCAW